MKNQYFGDRNDFFKYDLILTLIEKVDDLKSFTLIPMLTQDDGSGDGSLTNYDGGRRRELNDFLKGCIERSDRSIRNLRHFMSNYRHIEYHPYKDDEYFLHEKRREYFDGIDSSILNDSVILIDPDNGFEVKSMRGRNGHKYLKYIELSMLYARTGSNSLILVYQHIPRRKRENYFAQIGQMVQRCTNTRAMCLSDNRIALFIMAKTEGLLNKTRNVIDGYAKENGYGVYEWGDYFDGR
ncbi:TPA: hypothetical protein DCX15_03250 [bacterium]|nr:hypothetical protein [bacterium]